MKKKFLIILTVSIHCCLLSQAQVNYNDTIGDMTRLEFVAMAQGIAILGYENQNPFYLVTAAQILSEYPVSGTFIPDSSVLTNASICPVKVGEKILVLKPLVLLGDAESMAHGDSTMLIMIERTRLQLQEDTLKPRGREFSPMVQDYLLNADGKVELWATFNGNEIAEIFVMGSGSSSLDLFLYDNDNRLIGSDLKRADNCYLSFTPSIRQKCRIEIRNKGNEANQCLLMTN